MITPTADGASGKSYLLAIGVGGDPTKIERQGGYEDVYVKTPAGWRFKSRVHVFPNLRESVQFGPRGRRAPPLQRHQQQVGGCAGAVRGVRLGPVHGAAGLVAQTDARSERRLTSNVFGRRPSRATSTRSSPSACATPPARASRPTMRRPRDGFEKAASQGHVGAQFDLGLMYADGNGVPQDSVEAVRWLRKAADQGDARAQSNLGLMYANGSGVPARRGAGGEWYRKAALQGEVTAQFSLGLMYAERRRRGCRSRAGRELVQKAAGQGHTLAQYNLAIAYCARCRRTARRATGAAMVPRRGGAGDAEAQFSSRRCTPTARASPRDVAGSGPMVSARRRARAGARTDQPRGSIRRRQRRAAGSGRGGRVVRRRRSRGTRARSSTWACCMRTARGVAAGCRAARTNALSLAVAAASGGEAARYAGARDTVRTALTPEQIADAERLTREWAASHVRRP